MAGLNNSTVMVADLFNQSQSHFYLIEMLPILIMSIIASSIIIQVVKMFMRRRMTYHEDDDDDDDDHDHDYDSTSMNVTAQVFFEPCLRHKVRRRDRGKFTFFLASIFTPLWDNIKYIIDSLRTKRI